MTCSKTDLRAGKAGKRETGDLVTLPYEGRGKHVNVVLNSSDVWVEEIGNHAMKFVSDTGDTLMGNARTQQRGMMAVPLTLV